jgi:hypothetical protein
MHASVEATPTTSSARVHIHHSSRLIGRQPSSMMLNTISHTTEHLVHPYMQHLNRSNRMQYQHAIQTRCNSRSSASAKYISVASVKSYQGYDWCTSCPVLLISPQHAFWHGNTLVYIELLTSWHIWYRSMPTLRLCECSLAKEHALSKGDPRNADRPCRCTDKPTVRI